MDLKSTIAELSYKREQLAKEVATQDAVVQAILADGREKSKLLNTLQERLNHMDYAINNLKEIVQSVEDTATPPQPVEDPWG